MLVTIAKAAIAAPDLEDCDTAIDLQHITDGDWQVSAVTRYAINKTADAPTQTTKFVV